MKTIFDGNENGLDRATIPTTIVASAKTVPKISPIAKPSLYFFTALKEKNNSGIVVHIPTMSIPIKKGGMPNKLANQVHVVTVKCAHTSNAAKLIRRNMVFFIKLHLFSLGRDTSSLSLFLKAR